jgi:hypothetical protein
MDEKLNKINNYVKKIADSMYHNSHKWKHELTDNFTILTRGNIEVYSEVGLFSKYATIRLGIRDDSNVFREIKLSKQEKKYLKIAFKAYLSWRKSVIHNNALCILHNECEAL